MRCAMFCAAYVSKTVATWNERSNVLYSICKQNGPYMRGLMFYTEYVNKTKTLFLEQVVGIVIYSNVW